MAKIEPIGKPAKYRKTDRQFYFDFISIGINANSVRRLVFEMWLTYTKLDKYIFP